MRIDGRKNDELRNIRITRNYTIYAEGSVLIEMGNTKVICTATIDESVPAFLKGTGKGWVTAEYSMLPRATQTRTSRDIQKLRQNARSVEIQRLIGRALRMAVDLEALGERSVVIDCDVIQADGGTRTASISGGFVALYDAVRKLDKVTPFDKFPIVKNIAAVSVGIANNNEILDLCYEEDSKAEVDMNAVMDENGNFVELQGTGENGTFSPVQLNRLIELAVLGGKRIIEAQRLSINIDTEADTDIKL